MQRFCAAIILFPFIYPMRPRVICKGPSEEHVKQRKRACVAATQRKTPERDVNTVVIFMLSEWSDLWILANFRCEIIFSGLKKLLLDTRVNLLVVYSNKHMQGLWKSVTCVIFGAITGSMCERFVDGILNWSLVSFNLELLIIIIIIINIYIAFILFSAKRFTMLQKGLDKK